MNSLLYTYLQTLVMGNDRETDDSFIHVSTEHVPDKVLSVLNDTSDERDNESGLSHKGQDRVTVTGNDCEEEQEADDDTDESTEVGNSLAMDIVRENRRVILLGNPGGGKTTLLKHLLRSMALELMEDEHHGDIPLYIALKDITESRSLSVIVREVMFTCGLEEGLETGRVLFMLDGLNEVHPDCLEETNRAIETLLTDYPETGMIVTSRLYGYKGEFGFPVYRLDRFTDENILDYTRRRTSDDRLYHQITANDRIHSMVSNPLLLTMVIRIWEKENQLPDARLALYRQFIGYQLEKADISETQTKDLVIRVLSQMAFDMRKYGFLSDSVSGLQTVVSCIVGDEDAARVSDLLLGSGLLAVTSDGNGNGILSFVHETFQEYFCACYIYNRYMECRELLVDFSHPEWKETLQLLAEELIEHSDDLVAGFLNCIASQFHEGSETPYLNDRLDELVESIGCVNGVAPVIQDWMSQYVFMQMRNFLGLPEERQTLEAFGVLVRSLAALRNPSLVRLLVCSGKWQEYWLYDLESIESMRTGKNAGRLEIVQKHIGAFAGGKDIYLYLYRFNEEFDSFEQLNKSIASLKLSLCRSFNPDDFRYIYERNGEHSMLIGTEDEDYIRKEISDNTLLNITNLRSMILVYRAGAARLLYGVFLNRLCEGNRAVLLKEKRLRTMILKHRGIDELLLQNKLEKEKCIDVMKTLYAIPLEFLSPYYLEFQKQMRESMIRNGIGVRVRTLCEMDPGKFIIQVLDRSFLKTNQPLIDFLMKAFPGSELTRLCCCTFQKVKAPSEMEKRLAPSIHTPLCDGRTVRLFCNEDGYFTISDFKASFRKNKLYQAVIDDEKIYLRMTHKERSLFLSYDSPEDRLVTFHPEHTVTRDRFSLFHYLYRAEDFDAGRLRLDDNINTLSYNEQLQTGVNFGRLELFDLKDVGYVVSTHGDKVTMQMYGTEHIKQRIMTFRKFQPGQIVYFKSGSLLPLTDTGFLKKNILLEGEVINRKGSVFMIRCSTAMGNRIYRHASSDEMFVTGEKVYFFPIKGTRRHLEGVPLAVSVIR